MTLDTGLLQEHLIKLHETQGVPYSKMMAKSGVYNVSRIASGHITPRLDTWWRLHEAFPDDIPQPTLDNGVKIKDKPEGETGSKAPGPRQPDNEKKFRYGGEVLTAEEFYKGQLSKESGKDILDQKKHEIGIEILTTEELHYLKLLREIDKDGKLLSRHLMELLEKRIQDSEE